MIKQIRASYFANFKNAQYCALSSDPIPDYLENGDKVYLIDKGKNYIWDASSSSLIEDKTAINITEINDTLDTKAPAIINTASGAIASFDDGANGMPIKKLVAQIEPVQDLHGYDNPWPAGGRKNKFPVADWFTAYDASANYLIVGNTSVYVPSGTYTLSFEYYIDGITSVQSFCRTYSEQVTSVDASKQLEYQGLNLELSATTWTEKTVTFTLQNAGWFGIDDGQLRGGVHYRNIQLESGSSKTSFAPYSNICPISGWTGMTGQRTGKNLLRLVESEMTNVGGDREFPFSIKAGTYTLSCQNKFVVNSLEGCQIELRDDGNNNIATITTGYNFGNVEFSKTSVITEEMANAITKILFQPRAGNCTFANIMDAEIMLELGSSATDFNPFTGEAISVSWQDEAGTVYGGTLDVVSGVLTVDRAIVDLGTLTWVISETGSGRYYAAVNGIKQANSRTLEIICSCFKPNVGGGAFENCSIYNVDSRLYAVNNNFIDDVSGFTESVTEQVAVYPIATPQTYQLTPQQIMTLLGTNNVWADTGDIQTCEYPADTKLYIDGKIAEALGS